MPKVLIVAPKDLTPELGRTVLWRSDIERLFAADLDSGLCLARSVLPNLIVLDGVDSEGTRMFLLAIRADSAARKISLAVLGRTSSAQDEEALRRSGANLVLSGQVDPFLWDTRLEELLNVPTRRELRLPLQFQVWSRFAPNEPPLEALALNISVRGMLVETSEPLEVGTKLDLTFTLPGQEAPLRAVGQVIREALPHEGRSRSGIEFLILRGDARSRVVNFIEVETET